MVPTEWPSLQLSGSSPHTFQEFEGGGKLRVGEKEERTEVLQLSPTPLQTPLLLPVSKSYIYWEINTPWGSSFKPPRKHNGGGAAVAWATVQRPQTFLGDKMGFDGRKSSGHWCLLTSKANNKEATINQLALRE